MLEKWRRKRAEKQIFNSQSRAEIFDWIYSTNKWGSSESVSGKGSELGRTDAIRDYLPQLVEELGIKRLLDVPCGDLNWLNPSSLNCHYIGADIVPSLIERNRSRYPDLEFIVMDICRDPWPEADALMMRDVLVHLSFADIAQAEANLINSNATYLLCTTYPKEQVNQNKLTGHHRRLNMLLAPFAWPEPMYLFDEQEKHGKALGIWQMQSVIEVIRQR